LRTGCKEENIWTLEEVAGGWRRLQNEELHNLYTSTSVVRVIKSRIVMWAGHAERRRDEKCTQNFGWKSRREKATWKT